ncbi:hypothetical protein [Sorangium sp. So ce861]|uniref:hypothetical protein n=1 Tax=Sorangium sp. So ce861 TaxID=3133323 RepID=UPI003F62F1D9
MRRRGTGGGAMARVPLAAGAGALCAAAAWPGCNAIVGIEAPVREDAAATDAGSGSAGAGGDGPDCDVLEVVPGEALDLSLIDDMEDGNIGILKGDGATPRQGAWFKYNDGSEGGVQEPSDPAELVAAIMPVRGDSERGVRTSGNDRFTNWGAGVGFNLSNTYHDATGYRGITFWAYAEREAPMELLVTFVDRQTDPGGGVCGDEEGQVPCYDHFHTSVTLTSEWKHFKVPVGCLVQNGFGLFEALGQDTLQRVQFSLGPGHAFGFWIDDVAFYT